MCTSRNRLPAAVTEFTKAFFMQFFLGTYRGPTPHSTVLLSSQYTDGNYHSTGREKKKLKYAIIVRSENRHFLCFSGGDDTTVRIISICSA